MNGLVVILTALDLEYRAVREKLTDLRLHRHPAGTRFEVGRLAHSKCRVALALVGKGNHPAAVLAERAIAEFAPVAVLFVGVAGALWPSVALGDVVMATHVYAYHGGTSESDGLKARPRVWEVSHRADQIARHLDRTRDWAGKLPPGSIAPTVHFGPSGRTFRQFSAEDFTRFGAARERLPRYTGDQWGDGLKVINHLLNSVETPEVDLRLVTKELDALDIAQRDKIVRHLEMFLKGPIEDQIWARALAQVATMRMDRDRESRVWMFFQPKPAGPRVRQPDPVTTTITDWFWVTMTTTLFVTTAGYIGWLLVARGDVLALFAYLVSVAGGYTCFVKGLEWRDRVERLRAKEEQRRPHEPRAGAPPNGYADNVDRLFNRYFAKYRPEGADRKVWRADTAGTRGYLRDELVDVYRETRIKVDDVAWLIRYRIRDVARRWQDGTLWDYRDQLRTPAATKAAFALGLVPLVPGGVWAIEGAIRAKPLLAITALVLLAGSGCVGTMGWLRMALERRRFKADHTESQQRLADSQAEFDRWKRKLERTPSDSEMATWLDCDRKCLMDQTMRHYKLTPSQVIAHAFIEAPAASYKRARVPNGPWRYSKYQLLVFLLTTDGVRQLSADLDFQKGTFHDRKRVNYRFDAVAAVEVTETDDHRRTFELTLVNGQPIRVTVTESSTERTEQLQQGEDPGTLSRLALDATGLTNTLHVLEGVAAEGKEWIKHEYQRRTTD